MSRPQDGSHTNGKTPPTSGSGKRSKYIPRQVKGSVTWDELDPQLLIDTVTAVVGDGCAILLGASRDGGTLVVTICDADERIKYYAATASEMNGHLSAIYETASGHVWAGN